MRNVIVLASTAFLFTACKKDSSKEPAEKAAETSPSGGVQAKVEVPVQPAADKAPEAKKADPVPTTGAIKVKANFEEYNGDYDGSKAIFFRFTSTGGPEARLAVARDCPAFSCASLSAFGYSEDALKTACPKATWLVAEIREGDKQVDAKQGTNHATISLQDDGGGTTMTGNEASAVVEITQLGADTVTGTLSFGQDDGEYATFAKGPFTAKVCPNE